MSIVNTNSRISRWVVLGPNGRFIYKVYGESHDTMEEAIAAAIYLIIPIRHAKDYNISYDEPTYKMKNALRDYVSKEITIFTNFKDIICKAYDEINFKCANLDKEEKEFINAIVAMQVEDKLTL